MNRVIRWIVAGLLLTAGVRCEAARTRASGLRGTAVGVGQIMHMADFLTENPGCRTAILAYFKMDTMDARETVETIRRNASTQEIRRREFWPQIALETDRLSLDGFRRELLRPDSRVSENVRLLAREIARYRDDEKWFFIRPFSEMNDATPTAPWEMGAKHTANTPAGFAAAWQLLRRRFDEEGATNALFVFSPLAAYSVHHEKEVTEALNRIPIGSIDVFGLNVYSRPESAYGGRSHSPISFAALADPWFALLGRSKHRGIPLAVSEMAVSNQASDTARAGWLQNAFRYGRAYGYVMMTYFNYPHRYWQVHTGTRAGDALQRAMNGW